MMSPYLQRVSLAGYEWAERWRFEGLTLCPRPGIQWRTYDPLADEVGLFREFAAVEPTPEGIVTFANRYGELGVWRAKVRDFAGAKYAADEAGGDSLDHWRREIEAVRTALTNWDAKQAWEPIEAAVNAAFTRYVAPRLVQGADGVPAVRLVPKCLAGAIWVQVAEAVTGTKKTQRCVTCGRWFVLSPGEARADSRYCREACRSRAYRARKERAAQLASEGWDAKEIAAEVGSDAKTVRGWLKRAKGE